MNTRQPRHNLWLLQVRPWCLAVCLIQPLSCASGNDHADQPPVVHFNEHIRPIFTKHCIACHGGVKQAGDVSFVYRDKVLPPDGWIVEPGDPESSVILDRVTATDPEEVMPPPEHGDPLSDDEVALLRQWIAQGAPWQEHWAYERPQPQPLPDVMREGWCRNRIDRFVLARLEREGIAPSVDAEPERWLRRVTLDLTGLPPTVQQRADFLTAVSSRGERAYEDVVDQLLASPRFGERWASVWLDQIRYADSRGLGLDARRNIWKFRDWVISAFNRDLPYDDFTVMQIAGDLLPESSLEDRIATAAQRLTQTNEEGGTDDEEFRIGALMDRVSTTWQTWQGVTFGCVQCHSHPYAPFEHEEYYRFAAFFNNTADCDLNEDWPVMQAPLDPADYQRAAELDEEIDQLRSKVWQREFAALSDNALWQPLKGLTATSSNATRLQIEKRDGHEEFHTVGTVSRNADITVEAPLPTALKQLTAIRVTALPLDPQQAVADSEWGFVWSHLTAEVLSPGGAEPEQLPIARIIIDEPDPFFDPQESLNPKSNRGFSAYSRIHYPRQAALIMGNPVKVPDGATLRVTLKHRVYLLAAFSLITRRGHLAVSEDPRLTALLNDPQINEQRQRLTELQADRSRIRSTPLPVLRERPEHLARPTHVFIRGLFLTKGELVTPGTPAAFPPLPDGLPANRLTLAQWLVSPENPLTARVAVNRFWARLFGVGLVATEEDFGSSGEPPSHPELLDDLATRFQGEHRWSVKSLLREAVLSRTYRQSAKMRKELLERDPQNRLLARGPRYRLPAEIVRDQALAISGLLDDTMFGPPVHPPIPEGVWRPFAAGDRWQTPKPGEPDRYRRSIYTYTKRSIPYPMFAAFDAPSREFCTPRRLRSNTPLQALMTLNDATFAECSAALARRMQESAGQPADQVKAGFLLATGRAPDTQEQQALLTLYENSSQSKPLDGYEAVASVLLNLDEVLSK